VVGGGGGGCRGRRRHGGGLGLGGWGRGRSRVVASRGFGGFGQEKGGRGELSSRVVLVCCSGGGVGALRVTAGAFTYSEVSEGFWFRGRKWRAPTHEWERPTTPHLPTLTNPVWCLELPAK
jgi:hypothetical protein